MAKKKKIVKRDYQVINIKLESEHRSGTEVYMQLFEDVHNQRLVGKLRGEKGCVIRTLFHDPDRSTAIHGEFTSFTIIDSDNWINLENMTIEDGIDIAQNKYPNSKDTQYYFFAHIHRLFIPVKGGISAKTLIRFLEDAFRRVIEDDENITFTVEQSEDIIERIITAPEIHTLTINITPTNGDDVANEFAEIFDEHLKESGAAELQTTVKSSGRKGRFKITDLFKGLLYLARENGDARAVIIDEEEKSVTIDTKQHPNIISFEIPEGEQVEDSIREYAERQYVQRKQRRT